MINTNKGHVEFEGTPIEVLSDLALVIHCLYEDIFVKRGGIPEDEAKEMILQAVETGFIPPEELHKQNETVNDALAGILEKAVDLLETLVKGGHKE